MSVDSHTTWWANRKSRIGTTPAALPPPHLPGKEWLTTPPTSPPQPEHIEYVVEYRRQLLEQPQDKRRDVLIGRCSDWLRRARQLLHESVASQRGELHTTDGLIIEAEQALAKLIGKCVTAKLFDPGELDVFDEVRQALQARAARIKRERAIGRPLPERGEPMRLRVGARLRRGEQR